ncbi:MAG TPA: amino acid permease [Chthoniobacterales bacterium]|jgi:APA family basic amino acid/polyamine antiporter|nr:amino acid permease [Chthoniobacterales bacterium]
MAAVAEGKHTISPLTATCIVVANMVGTGIFTSLGFQVAGLPTGFAIMALWIAGGLCALCGALSYAELGAALPRSGGEYHFLGVIYHPAVGFLAGWVSATVGFAAPVAIAAIAFGTYFAEAVPGLNPLVLSLAVVTICTVVLLRDLQLGSAFQNGSTILKIALIVIIIAAGFLVGSSQPVSFLPVKGDGALIMSAPFAVSLYWVMYAYSGWNASTYIVGELRNPARTIPLSVGLGTILVMALYLSMNAVFLRTTPMADMVGKQQVAVIAGTHIFGGAGAKLTALFICLGLVSTVSGMMWIGPRITAAMGEDLRALSWLGRRNPHGVPTIAILTQFAIVVMMLLTATFETAVNYVQFSLTLCSTLAVLGVFVLRWRQPNLPRPYRTWGYPITPLIFLAISLWMLEHMLADASTRAPSLWGLATMALGLIVYFLSPKNKPARAS